MARTQWIIKAVKNYKENIKHLLQGTSVQSYVACYIKNADKYSSIYDWVPIDPTQKKSDTKSDTKSVIQIQSQTTWII
jgi:hypothetical protein